MREITQKGKTVSYILKAIVIISAVVGTILSAINRRGTFMAGKKVFMYFTIQSNIAIALICIIGVYMLIRDRTAGNAWWILALFFLLIIIGYGYLSIADRLERNNVKNHVKRPCLLRRSEG